MRATALIVVLVGCFCSNVAGWGYVFSRFRPQPTNLGYGGAGGALAERWTPREHLLRSILGEELLEEELCSGRRCSSNEHCCSEHICVSFDSESGGTCLAAESHRLSYECVSDLDCNEGQMCEMGNCAHAGEKKGYSEPCMESSECDFGKGLCCQLHRRHRQAPRKVCSYFKDPLTCIGHVESVPMKRLRPSQ